MSIPASAKRDKHIFAVTSIGWQNRSEFFAIGERFQGRFGHRVHRERCRECLDVKNIGSRWILCARAGPQEALGISPSVVDSVPARRTEQLARRLVRAHGDGNPKLMIQFTGSLCP